MGVFEGCTDYKDYIEIIRKGIFEENVNVYENNRQAFEYLCGFTDEDIKQKIISAFRVVDRERGILNSFKRNMEAMINSLLAIGVLFKEFPEIINGLNATDKVSLLSMGAYSCMDDLDRKLIRVYADNALLDSIGKKYTNTKRTEPFALGDLFFMIKEHYKKEEFDINDEGKLAAFIQDMIHRINTDTLHDGVDTILESIGKSGLLEPMRRP